jgi:hypothetical protein
LRNCPYIKEVLPVHWPLQGVDLRQVRLEPRVALDLLEDLRGSQLCEVGHVHHPDLGVLEHL